MTIRPFKFAAALALALAAFGTEAAAVTVAEATTLEAVVVTPSANYSASQWQARQSMQHASRNAVVLERVIVTPTARYSVAEWNARRNPALALAAVTLEPVIVTPHGSYTLAEWQQRQSGLAYAKQQRSVRGWLQAVWRTVRLARSPIAV